MKKRLVGLLVLLTLVISLFSLPMTAFAASQIKVLVNYKDVNFPDTKPFMDSNSRVLVPVRFVSEVLGCKVGWNEATQTVTIEKEGLEVTLKINDKFAIKNGTRVNLDTAAVMKNGRTMVPVRFISEVFGCKVNWNGTSNTVLVETPDYKIKDATEFEKVDVKDFIKGTFPKDKKTIYLGSASDFPITIDGYTIYGIDYVKENPGFWVTQSHPEGIGITLMYLNSNNEYIAFRRASYFKSGISERFYGFSTAVEEVPTKKSDIAKIAFCDIYGEALFVIDNPYK
jgi:hypothetical protein